MNKKEQQAIDFLRSMERDDLLSLGFSGGKDSVVIDNISELLLGITHWMPIPSFDEILEANKDVLERIKEKGD